MPKAEELSVEPHTPSQREGTPSAEGRAITRKRKRAAFAIPPKSSGFNRVFVNILILIAGL